MTFVNYHSHSNCSPDGHAIMSEMAAAAVRAGIAELCVTDHCDMLNLNGDFNDGFDWAPILDQHARAMRDWGGQVCLPLGIELGGAVHQLELAGKILSLSALDFAIGSIHNPGRAPDIYYTEFPDEAGCYRVLDAYMEEMLALASSGLYDVLGHLTYPLRYMNGRDGNSVCFDRYHDALREVFRVVIEKGRGIELNTSGYRFPGGAAMPPLDILRLYRKCGGEIITIGSDAHRPEHIVTGLDIGYGLLRQAGFEYVAVYRRRKPAFIEID